MCGGEGRGGSAPAIVLFMLPSLRALSFMLRALFMLQPTLDQRRLGGHADTVVLGILRCRASELIA